MKTKGLNSTEQLKGFSDTFSIYALLKNSRETIQTIQNPSEIPNNNDLRSEELKPNHSEPFSVCQGCQHKETIGDKGDGCNTIIQGEFSIQWTLLDTLGKCPRGYWN